MDVSGQGGLPADLARISSGALAATVLLHAVPSAVPEAPYVHTEQAGIELDPAHLGAAGSGPEGLFHLFRRGPIRCAGQVLGVPKGRYDWIYLLLDPVPPATYGQAADTVWLYYSDSVEQVSLPLPPHPALARVPVNRAADLVAFGVPERPELGLSAVTLVN